MMPKTSVDMTASMKKTRDIQTQGDHTVAEGQGDESQVGASTSAM